MPDYDLWYVAAGKGRILVNDVWVPFAPGDLLAIKPGDRYQEERSDMREPFQIYYAHMLLFRETDLAFAPGLNREWPLKINMLHQPAVANLFAELLRAHTLGGEDHTLRLKSLALQILDIVFAELRQPLAAVPPKVYLNLLKAKQFVDQEYAQDLRVEEIAAFAGLSSSYLSALFRRHFDCSPAEYLQTTRINEAKLLLARGLAVKAVAAETGFHSLHYFSRVFTRRTGVAPSEYARLSLRRLVAEAAPRRKRRKDTG